MVKHQDPSWLLFRRKKNASPYRAMPIKCHIWTKAIYYARAPKGTFSPCAPRPIFSKTLEIWHWTPNNRQPLQMIWSKADMQVILGLRWLPFGPKLHVWGNRTASPRTEYCWSSSRSRCGVSCGDLGARPGCSCSQGIRWCTGASFTLEVVFLFISFISHLDGAFWCIL